MNNNSNEIYIVATNILYFDCKIIRLYVICNDKITVKYYLTSQLSIGFHIKIYVQ